MAEKTSMTITITIPADIVERLSPAEKHELTMLIEMLKEEHNLPASVKHFNYMMIDSMIDMVRKGVRPARLQENPEERIQALRAAVDGFWDGMSEEDIEETIAAMNSEYVDPKDLTMWNWLDEIPEDER